MTEPEKHLKKKDQVLFDEQEAIRLQAQFDEEARDKVETDYELAQRLQQKEQEELTIEEKSKLFAAKRAEERGTDHQLKLNKEELFDKAMKRVNTFVDFRTELVEGTEREESSKRDETIGQEISSKRVGDELEQEKAKNQKIDDDQEEAKLKELMEVISDEEGVAIDDIPLSTKPLSIVDYKIIKEGKIIIYQIIRADGSLKRHGYTRPKEGYKRVLWGDLKTMFEHHVEDLVWRFSNMHHFMLVEKIYTLTKATITEMLNKKLQADHWNEMCYQLLKLVTKQLRINEVFGSILLVFMKLLMKKLDDFEDKYPSLGEDCWD
ncbi:hypothetical protein Tco_1085296 [Tanacetum coccineum]